MGVRAHPGRRVDSLMLEDAAELAESEMGLPTGFVVRGFGSVSCAAVEHHPHKIDLIWVGYTSGYNAQDLSIFPFVIVAGKDELARTKLIGANYHALGGRGFQYIQQLADGCS